MLTMNLHQILNVKILLQSTALCDEGNNDEFVLLRWYRKRYYWPDNNTGSKLVGNQFEVILRRMYCVKWKSRKVWLLDVKEETLLRMLNNK